MPMGRLSCCQTALGSLLSRFRLGPHRRSMPLSDVNIERPRRFQVNAKGEAPDQFNTREERAGPGTSSSGGRSNALPADRRTCHRSGFKRDLLGRLEVAPTTPRTWKTFKDFVPPLRWNRR